MQSFTHSAFASHIIFGRGAITQINDAMDFLGVSSALILCTPYQKLDAEALSAHISSNVAGIFAGAVMHTPFDVSDVAIAYYNSINADCVVAIGGGSTTGLGKAIASRTNAPQIVIPTTYAGSEVTPILGETENGIKTTRRGPDILPEVVIYDPNLSQTLPVEASIASGLNAMAHAVEGIYAKESSPIYRMMALEALRSFKSALPAILADPLDVQARDEALYAAWLCGTVLGGVGMSIHHKLCHTLGGALDLPHAQTHAILLPHTINFVEQTIPAKLACVGEIFEGKAGIGLYDFSKEINAPTRLADIGVEKIDLNRLADLAVANPYWCPRKLDHSAILELLTNAWEGTRPF